jgi:RNA polymerase sigma-70 factor (ECF subfamily)
MHEPLVLIDDDLERVSALGEYELEVQRLLGDLPDEQRRAIVARVLEERDYADIAAELECSAVVVRKRVSRGLATLRLRLKEMT